MLLFDLTYHFMRKHGISLRIAAAAAKWPARDEAFERLWVEVEMAEHFDNPDLYTAWMMREWMGSVRVRPQRDGSN